MMGLLVALSIGALPSDDYETVRQAAVRDGILAGWEHPGRFDEWTELHGQYRRRVRTNAQELYDLVASRRAEMALLPPLTLANEIPTDDTLALGLLYCGRLYGFWAGRVDTFRGLGDVDKRAQAQRILDCVDKIYDLYRFACVARNESQTEYVRRVNRSGLFVNRRRNDFQHFALENFAKQEIQTRAERK